MCDVSSGNCVIYSMGDDAILAQILNGVAMITGDGSFMSMILLGAIAGFTIMMFQAITNGIAKSFSSIFLGWLVFTTAFGTNIDVTVENIYNGTSTSVSNVPLGVAFVGSVMSQVGYNTTSLFEQAYSYPGVTTAGFAHPIRLYADVRENAIYKSCNFGDANSPAANDNICLSYKNYIRNCTQPMLDSGAITEESMRSQPLINAIRSTSTTTNVWLMINGAPQSYTCSAGWTALYGATTSAFSPLYLGVGGSPGQSVMASLIEYRGSITIAQEISDAENILLSSAPGATGLPTWYMAWQSFLEPIYFKARIEHLESLNQAPSQVMMDQAYSQRNIAWIGHEEMFSDMLPVVTGFIEGFIYSVTPLMAFIIVMGVGGISLAGKWLLTAFWIQLWMPLFAIVNLYIMMNVTEGIQDISTRFTGWGSMQYFEQVDTVIYDWLGRGSKLITTVPFLSAFLIFGSSVGMNAIARTLNDGDKFVNEKLKSPDLRQPAPIMSEQSMHQGSPVYGPDHIMSSQFANTMNTTLSSDSNYTKQSQQAQTKAKNERADFSASWSKAANEEYKDIKTFDQLAQHGATLKSTQGDYYSKLLNQASSSEDTSQMTESQQNAFVASMDAQLSAGTGNKSPLKGSAGGSVDSRSTSTEGEQIAGYVKKAETALKGEGVKQELTRDAMSQFSQSDKESLSSLYGESESSKLQQEATEAYNASSEARRIETLSVGQSSSQNRNLANIAESLNMRDMYSQYMQNNKDMSGLPETQQKLWQEFQSVPNGEEYLSNFATDHKGQGSDWLVWSVGLQKSLLQDNNEEAIYSALATESGSESFGRNIDNANGTGMNNVEANMAQLEGDVKPHTEPVKEQTAPAKTLSTSVSPQAAGNDTTDKVNSSLGDGSPADQFSLNNAVVRQEADEHRSNAESSFYNKPSVIQARDEALDHAQNALTADFAPMSLTQEILGNMDGVQGAAINQFGGAAAAVLDTVGLESAAEDTREFINSYNQSNLTGEKSEYLRLPQAQADYMTAVASTLSSFIDVAPSQETIANLEQQQAALIAGQPNQLLGEALVARLEEIAILGEEGMQQMGELQQFNISMQHYNNLSAPQADSKN